MRLCKPTCKRTRQSPLPRRRKLPFKTSTNPGLTWGYRLWYASILSGLSRRSIVTPSSQTDPRKGALDASRGPGSCREFQSISRQRWRRLRLRYLKHCRQVKYLHPLPLPNLWFHLSPILAGKFYNLFCWHLLCRTRGERLSLYAANATRSTSVG